VPAVLKVKLDKVRVPATSVRFPVVAPLSSAITALPSELVMVTLVVAVLTTFQLASTALITMPLGIGVPEYWSDGVPILPVAVPGAVVYPGTKIWNFTKAPVLTEMAGLVLAVLVPSVMSEAVTVRLPAVFMVTLKVPVPEASGALPGRMALVSDEVIPTV